jgi:TonB family protein
VRSTSFAPSVADGDGVDGLAVRSRSDEGAAIARLRPGRALDHRLRVPAAAERARPGTALRDPSRGRAGVVFGLGAGAQSGSGEGFHPAPRRSFDERGAPVGAASVAIWISAAGSVEWAEIILSSGRREWDDLALELFSDVVTFRPARLQGVNTPMSAIFTVDFPW